MSILKKSLKKGFTLIELLIVIAILGLLAVSLIVAIDPVEQINRANDSAKRQLATNALSGMQRYFANKQFSPNCNPATSACTGLQIPLNTPTLLNATGFANINAALNVAGETNSTTSFSGNTQASNVYAVFKYPTGSTSNSDVTPSLCWRPSSKAQKTSADQSDINSTIWQLNLTTGDITQGSAAQCPATASNTCYQCIQQ